MSLRQAILEVIDQINKDSSFYLKKGEEEKEEDVKFCLLDFSRSLGYLSRQLSSAVKAAESEGKVDGEKGSLEHHREMIDRAKSEFRGKVTKIDRGYFNEDGFMVQLPDGSLVEVPAGTKAGDKVSLGSKSFVLTDDGKSLVENE